MTKKQEAILKLQAKLAEQFGAPGRDIGRISAAAVSSHIEALIDAKIDERIEAMMGQRGGRGDG